MVTAAAAFGVGTAIYLGTDSAECSWYNPLSWFGSGYNLDSIRDEIEDLITENEAGPLFVRLAWHSSGTFDKVSNTGGSNGATMRFPLESNDPANAGLQGARAMLEDIKARNPSLSYADLYTFAGVVAVEYMGSPKIEWKAGRSDAADESACPPNGRLPDAAQGAAHLRDIFYRMGFNDREIVALSGAHTLGRCHTDRSGFDGPWTRDPNGLDNDYFRLLFDETWTIRPKFTPTQYEDSSKELMMLPTDMAIIWDPAFKQYARQYADDGDLWLRDFAAAFGKLLELGVPRK
jgi:catalase (peroxidase I)